MEAFATETEIENLKCLICQFMAETPVKISVCSHLFCNKCLSESIKAC